MCSRVRQACLMMMTKQCSQACSKVGWACLTPKMFTNMFECQVACSMNPKMLDYPSNVRKHVLGSDSSMTPKMLANMFECQLSMLNETKIFACILDDPNNVRKNVLGSDQHARWLQKYPHKHVGGSVEHARWIQKCLLAYWITPIMF